jgi:hypothetical protein
MWGIMAQKGEREGGKKERKGERERKRVELVISMRAPYFFKIHRISKTPEHRHTYVYDETEGVKGGFLLMKMGSC